MKILIYLIIVLLFGVLVLWTWNNTKDFKENKNRIIYILIGMLALSIITLIIFNISKIGIKYPNNEILNYVRKISVMLFIPVNGFLSLPHIAKIKTDIELKLAEDEKIKKRIIILAIIIIISIIVEIIYLKDFQNGIIKMISNSQIKK